MKYCLRYYGKDIDLLNYIDEIILPVSKIKDLDNLKKFCEKHKKQRIILFIDNKEKEDFYIEYCFSFQEQYQKEFNIIIKLLNYNKEKIDNIKEHYFNPIFFFSTPVTSWSLLKGFINLGVSDLYIVEDLGFELEQISKIIKNKQINIRVYPNVAQSAWNDTDDLKKFWIRPEDYVYYNDFVDIYEFFGDDEKQKIYYDIYAIDKKWSGNLKEIIIGLKEDLNSLYIVPRFGEKRTRCCLQCLKNNTCYLCNSIKDLSQSLENANLIVNIEKKGE